VRQALTAFDGFGNLNEEEKDEHVEAYTRATLDVQKRIAKKSIMISRRGGEMDGSCLYCVILGYGLNGLPHYAMGFYLTMPWVSTSLCHGPINGLPHYAMGFVPFIEWCIGEHVCLVFFYRILQYTISLAYY